jgi:hypothetical protein
MNVIHNVPSYVKIEPYGKTTDVAIVAGASTVNVRAVASDVLDFYFPKGYIDLSSLDMLFKYFCLPYAAVSSTQAIPKDTECLIQTLEVYLGGKRVNYITNYNHIFFILSHYGSDATYRAKRDSFQNIWTNGRPTAVASIDGNQFCCDKWLGLLGLPIVLDTHTLGQLHVRVTLAPPQATLSNNTSHSWGISDVFMRVKYYENYDKELPRYIEFDDFKSILNSATSHNQTTNLIVNSSRIDYVLGRLLRPDALTKGAALVADILTTILYASVPGGLTSWNFAVNNKQIYRYKPTTADALASVLEVFKNGNVMNSNSAPFNSSTRIDRALTCAAEVGFQSEIQEQVEISYITEGTSGTGCFPLLIAKLTASLEITKDGQVIHNA